LRHSLWVDFDAVFTFLELIAVSDALESSHFHRQVLLQFSQNCIWKLRKLQEIGKTVCVLNFV